MRASASPGDRRNPFYVDDRSLPPLNLVADDPSAAHRRNLGEHLVQRHSLSLLSLLPHLAVARSAGEGVAGVPRARADVAWPRVRHASATQALNPTCLPAWRHVISRAAFLNPRALFWYAGSTMDR